MGIISDVKCGRCDRRYSGLRARCPYCGARRGKRGKHANDADNSKGKLIIGLLLILVLIVAVVVLVVTSINEKNRQQEQQNNEEQHQNFVDDDDVTSVPGTAGNQTGNDASGGSQTDSDAGAADADEGGADAGDTGAGNDAGNGAVDGQQAKVTAVSILCFGAPTNDFTIDVGQKLNLSYSTTPADMGTDIEWKSSDENVFVILQTGEFTAIGSGMATLTLTVDGVTADCIVRVN